MKRTAALRRLTPLKRTPMKRRAKRSGVPDWLFGYLLGRDKTCRARHLGATDACHGRLTIEHVKFESRIGKRAASDPQHTLLLCLGHNTGWALLTASKEAERGYLRRVERWKDEEIPPCPECRPGDIHFADCPENVA